MNRTPDLVCENDTLTDVNGNLLGSTGGEIVQDAVKTSAVSAILHLLLRKFSPLIVECLMRPCNP